MSVDEYLAAFSITPPESEKYAILTVFAWRVAQGLATELHWTQAAPRA